MAKLPPGSRRDSHDRYAETSFPWKTLVVVALVLYIAWSWYQGQLDDHLPMHVRSTQVLGSWAPRSSPPPAPPAPPASASPAGRAPVGGAP